MVAFRIDGIKRDDPFELVEPIDDLKISLGKRRRFLLVGRGPA